MSDPLDEASPPPAPEDRALRDGALAKGGLLHAVQVLVGASRGFWLVNLVNFGDGIAYFGFLTLLTLFLQEQAGFSTQAAGYGVSLFTGAVTLFMALGAGALSDRLGSRRALTAALSVTLLGRIVLVLSPEAGGLVAELAWASLVIMAFGEGVIQPALYAGVKEYTDKRTATMGYAYLYAIMNLGIVAGELVSPLVRETWARQVQGLKLQDAPRAGISGAFWLFIAVTALLVLANLLFFTRKVEARDRQGVTGQRPHGSTLGERLRSLPILDLRFLYFIFILLPVRTLFAHQWLTMPDYVTRAFPAEVGARWEWLSGINPLIIVVFVPLFAALTQRRRVVDMMIVGTLVSAAAPFLLVPAPDLGLLIAYFALFSLGEAVWSSRFLEYIADIAPAQRVGIYMGIASLPWFLAKATTGLYSGWMLERFVPVEGAHATGTLWLIYACVALVSPLGLLIARRWLLAGETSAGAP